MNRFREYKSIISNIVLVITTTILVPYFSNESLAKDELKLTDGILLIAVILLLFERKINQEKLFQDYYYCYSICQLDVWFKKVSSFKSFFLSENSVLVCWHDSISE